MMNVWVKTYHDGLIRAACIIRIDNDGAALRVWHRAGGDAAVSAVKVCEVPDLNSKLPETFGEQLAALITSESMAVVEAVHGPSGWWWKVEYAETYRREWSDARDANRPPVPEQPVNAPASPEPSRSGREWNPWGPEDT